MVRNIGHDKLIEHLKTLPTGLSVKNLKEILDRRLDLYQMYNLLRPSDDHIVMMAVSYPYLRLAIERGDDLRQRNISDWTALEIARQLYPDQSRRNKTLIVSWLKRHPLEK